MGLRGSMGLVVLMLTFTGNVFMVGGLNRCSEESGNNLILCCLMMISKRSPVK
jgi:hypothetical protein